MSTPLTLLCVHPHPDDEAIACGGVLARAVATGVRAVVVTCTGGEEGDNLAGIDLGDIDMATHRRRELADALAALGVVHHHWLGYRDSGMVDTPGNGHPDSFHMAEVDEAAVRLAAIIREERPQVVVSDDEHGSYGHPDHVKANRVTIRAVELAADPDAPVAGAPWRVAKRYVHTLGRGRLLAAHNHLLAAGLNSPFGDEAIDAAEDLPFGTDDEQVTTEVDVSAWMEQKRAALAAYRSQIGPDSFFLNTPQDMAGAFFGIEQFTLEAGVAGAPVGGGPEDDLFAGLTVGPPGAEDGADADGPTDEAFRAVLGRFATGVAIMTSVADGQPHGMTANAISSVSLDPPLVLVCVDRTAVMAEVVEKAQTFALSWLSDEQATLSQWFADPERPVGADQFGELSTQPAATGSPILDGAHGWVDCRVWATYDGGDHVIVVGRVEALGEAPTTSEGATTAPLVYHRGGYAGLGRPT
jgi:N-acetyl-1-D-myo-inositol-2-amino-2-deoxy-alpha-D-glucopyranoside deacetylase